MNLEIVIKKMASFCLKHIGFRSNFSYEKIKWVN
jgi:hypothetical protein